MTCDVWNEITEFDCGMSTVTRNEGAVSRSTTPLTGIHAQLDLGVCAVGSSDGVVIIWDLTRGVVSRIIGKLNESPAPSESTFSKD